MPAVDEARRALTRAVDTTLRESFARTEQEEPSARPPADGNPVATPTAAKPHRPPPMTLSARTLPWSFSAALFLSAALLFCIQPMAAKTLLPFVGGAPSAWNACMLFFQAMLIGGYAYAHWTTRLRVSWAPGVVHLGVVMIAAIVLPLELTLADVPRPGEEGPVWWLLIRLSVLVGLPFFALSGTAPLLQDWFSRTGHARAADPYFLYAASNAGSMVGLFGFIALLEPSIGLHAQGRIWSWGYWVLAALLVTCLVASSRKGHVRENASASSALARETPPATWRQRGFWIFAAFVPSSLMLGVTLHLSTDIGALPFLWVVPLGLYLLSYVLVFARRQILPKTWIRRVFPVCIIAAALVLVTGNADPPGAVVAIHLVVFFCAAMVCHGRLAESRPPVAQLTEFYFCLALGGVCGGLFNTLIAPLIFDTIVEYPLALVLACTLLLPRSPAPAQKSDRRKKKAGRTNREPSRWTQGAGRWLRVAAVVGIGLFTFTAGRLVTDAGVQSIQMQAAIILAAPLVACWALAEWPLTFATAVGALFVGGISYPSPLGRSLHVERDFFGVSRVTMDSADGSRQIVHGNTIHGRQFIDPAKSAEPIVYYHRKGPAGDIFRWLDRKEGTARVAVVGLGAGSLLAYSKPGQEWTFYEIDPIVIRIASDPAYFSYVANNAADSLEIVVGDGRLGLGQASDEAFDLIVLDAFSSDAIPVHLLTQEAIDLYLSKLAPDGLLAFHISSRYFGLEPVLAEAAESLRVNGMVRTDFEITSSDILEGRERSHWAVIARPGTRLEAFARARQWRPLESRSGIQTWTDDYSSPMKALLW